MNKLNLTKNCFVKKDTLLVNKYISFNSTRITIKKDITLKLESCTILGNCILEVYGNIEFYNCTFSSESMNKGVLLILHGKNDMKVENFKGYKYIEFFYPNSLSSLAFFNFNIEPQIIINLESNASLKIIKGNITDYKLIK